MENLVHVIPKVGPVWTAETTPLEIIASSASQAMSKTPTEGAADQRLGPWARCALVMPGGVCPLNVHNQDTVTVRETLKAETATDASLEHSVLTWIMLRGVLAATAQELLMSVVTLAFSGPH